MHILLTNDDSHSSPLLDFIVAKLKTLGSLTIVVPKHEQSWKGKAMSRFETLHAEEITLHGEPAYTVSGTPADCVNIGIHNLCTTPPDLVVSGINTGLNAGLGFIIGSGTVGACFEANIAGLPGIALSQMFNTETKNRYAADYTIASETIRHLRTQSAQILDALFEKFLSSPELLKDHVTWNVNFPWQLAPDWKLKLCPVGYTTYGRCYTNQGLGYEHSLSEIHFDSDPESDSALLRDGQVTITPLDLLAFGQVGLERLGKLGASFFD